MMFVAVMVAFVLKFAAAADYDPRAFQPLGVTWTKIPSQGDKLIHYTINTTAALEYSTGSLPRNLGKK